MANTIELMILVHMVRYIIRDVLWYVLVRDVRDYGTRKFKKRKS